MTNKIELIVQELEKRLQALGFATIRWTEEQHTIGNLYPYCVIKEGDQEYIADSGQLYNYKLKLTLAIVSDDINSRIKTMNDYQVSIFNTMFQQANFAPLWRNVNPIAVRTGDLIRGTDINIYAGFTEATTVREIEIEFDIQDSRV